MDGRGEEEEGDGVKRRPSCSFRRGYPHTTRRWRESKAMHGYGLYVSTWLHHLSCTCTRDDRAQTPVRVGVDTSHMSRGAFTPRALIGRPRSLWDLGTVTRPPHCLGHSSLYSLHGPPPPPRPHTAVTRFTVQL